MHPKLGFFFSLSLSLSLSLCVAIRPYQPSHLVSFLDGTHFSHRDDECKSLLVDLCQLVCPWVGVHWRTSFISSYGNLISREFLQAVTVSILLYGCTTWTQTKRLEKKVRWELHKDAAPFKTVTVQPLTSHHTNYPSRITNKCDAPLDKLINGDLLWT